MKTSYKEKNWQTRWVLWLHCFTWPYMSVIKLSRGPGTSSFGPYGLGNPLRWSPVSRPVGLCSPGSQQRWSPEKRPCCSPGRKGRLGTGSGSPPWRAHWWGWGRPQCRTAANAWATSRRYNPGQWSRRWCWHSPGCRWMAGHSSWGKVKVAACRGPRRTPEGPAGVRWLGSRWKQPCFQCWSSGPDWALIEQRRDCRSLMG